MAREAALGRLAAGLWHETLNLLSVAGFWAKNLHETPPGPSPEDRMNAAIEELTRLAKAQHACAVGALRQFAERFDARTLVTSALELARPQLASVNIIGAACLPEAPVLLDGSFGEGVLALALVLGRVARSGGSALGPARLEVTLTPATPAGTALVELSGKALEACDLAGLRVEGDPELALVASLADGARLHLAYP